MSKSIKKNTIYSIVKSVSSIIFPLITFPYASRILLVDNIGKINFGLSIVNYFSLLASLGISVYAIRECSKCSYDRRLLSEVASEIFTLDLITTVFSYCFLFLTLFLFKKLSDYKFLIIVQSLPIIFSTLGTDWINTAMEDFRFITLRTLFFQLLSLILLFLIVKKPDDYLKYALITVISSSGANIVNILYRRRFCDISFCINRFVLRHLKPVLFLFVMLLAQTIFNNIDATMLGIMNGNFEVGIYSTAHKVCLIISTLISTFVWVVLPKMSYYFSKNSIEEINLLLSKAFSFYFTFGLPCVVGAIVLSKEVILIVAGSEFLLASSILKILMVSVFFDIVGGMFLGNTILLPSGREKYFMIVCVVCAVINVVLNYYLIPLYGAYGAALSTVFCRVVMAVLLLIRVDKRINIKFFKETIFNAITGSAIIVIVCVLFKNIESVVIKTTVSILVSALLYTIYMVIMKNQLVVDLLNEIKYKIKNT